MDVKIKRLLASVGTAAVAAALLVSGTYAAPVTQEPGDNWIAAVDWEDTKDDETQLPVSPPGDEQVIVSGKKTWDHGKNPIAKRPTSITIIIKADDSIVTQRLITAADHWAWSFMLPKFNGEGKEIKYTVDEARFEDYVKAVDGYNIINIYKPGGNTDDPDSGLPGGSPPKTDDTGNPALWLTLMAASLGALVVIIFSRRRRSEEKQT